MSNKDSIKSNEKIIEMKSSPKSKSKKVVLQDLSNKDLNINVSIDEIKKEDQKLKTDSSPTKGQAEQEKSQKAELQKQKAQALKILKNIQKQQKQFQVMIQKSAKKLPQIRQSPTNKQNQPLNQIKKNQPLSVHVRTEHDQSSPLLRNTKTKNLTTQSNYSIVNNRKVYMSEEDVVKLHKLKLQYKNREHQIKKKVIAHELMIQKMKTEEIMSKEKRVEEERQKRLKSIEQRQKIISKQRQQKIQRFQQQNKRLKQLKKSKKLFQKMEQRFLQIEEKQKQNINEMIKSHVGQGTVNFDQIKEHERQYLQRNKQTIENSRIKIQSRIRQLEEEFNHLNLHKSQFYQRVKNEKKEVIQQIQENERRRKVCSQKIKEYKQLVKQNYMPKIVRKQVSEEKKKLQLNPSQIHNMGNEYMKQGVKLIDRNKSLNLLEKMKKSEAERTTKKAYKNYLHQNSTQSSPQMKPKSRSQSKEILMEKQMKSINAIKNPKQKYEKIKILHNKIQQDLKSNMPVGGKAKLKLRDTQANLQNDKQVKQIKAKLQLLEGLEG